MMAANGAEIVNTCLSMKVNLDTNYSVRKCGNWSCEREENFVNLKILFQLPNFSIQILNFRV